MSGEQALSADQEGFANWTYRFLLGAVLPKLRRKGQAYRNVQASEPAWSNILAMAGMTGTTPAQALLVLMSKHQYALCQWAQGMDLPDAEDRIVDIVVFCLLLIFMEKHIGRLPWGRLPPVTEEEVVQDLVRGERAGNY